VSRLKTSARSRRAEQRKLTRERIRARVAERLRIAADWEDFMSSAREPEPEPDEKVCVYCGDWLQCRDHLTPVCYDGARADLRGKTVPCCHECNGLAGPFVAFSIAEKAQYLVARYQRKYAWVLALPEWDVEEIDELTDLLREDVLRNQLRRRLVLQKLCNLELVALGVAPRPIKRRVTL
jgi:hypothetical protein